MYSVKVTVQHCNSILKRVARNRQMALIADVLELDAEPGKKMIRLTVLFCFNMNPKSVKKTFIFKRRFSNIII